MAKEQFAVRKRRANKDTFFANNTTRFAINREKQMNDEMNFETYVEFVVFSDNPAKWKIEQLQKAILERKTGAKDAKGSKIDSLF